MELATEKARLMQHLASRIEDSRVFAAMGRIPRECFVPARYEYAAYINEPLPIGCDQTISQPLIIAMMTEALGLTGNEKVLEIGTGSGYQTAILAELAYQVITIERLPSLLEPAQRLLQALGYSNITFHLAGDNLGWRDESPYDAIIVTAGAPSVPDILLEQLAMGGRLVIPVGSRQLQELLQISKGPEKNVIHNLGGCRFVPLIGEEAWQE